MKRASKFLISFLLVVMLIQIVGIAASCYAPTSAWISLNKSGKHSATTRVSGILLHSGTSSYENHIVTRVVVKVGVRPSDATYWYDETSSTKRNSSSGSHTQSVSPIKHYLIGAKGSYSVTCSICEKTSSKNISYTN